MLCGKDYEKQKNVIINSTIIETCFCAIRGFINF
jgi:hypothetical protein